MQSFAHEPPGTNVVNVGATTLRTPETPHVARTADELAPSAAQQQIRLQCLELAVRMAIGVPETRAVPLFQLADTYARYVIGT